MKPAEFTTDAPPVPVQNVELQEYIFALRRRIEVQNCLLESLAEQVHKLKQERDGLTDHLERVLLDLHWYESGRNMNT